MNPSTPDYAAGTRTRKWLGIICRPALRLAVRWLLHLCPDTPIVANVAIGKNNAGLSMANAVDGQIINVRVDMSDRPICAVRVNAPKVMWE